LFEWCIFDKPKCAATEPAIFSIGMALDWQEFLKEGVDAEKLRATGDAMALKVVKVAENGRR